jgi:hypothetical protein
MLWLKVMWVMVDLGAMELLHLLLMEAFLVDWEVSMEVKREPQGHLEPDPLEVLDQLPLADQLDVMDQDLMWKVLEVLEALELALEVLLML